MTAHSEANASFGGLTLENAGFFDSGSWGRIAPENARSLQLSAIRLLLSNAFLTSQLLGGSPSANPGLQAGGLAAVGILGLSPGVTRPGVNPSAPPPPHRRGSAARGSGTCLRALPFTALPPGKRAWVNTQAFRHFFLREAPDLSILYKLLSQCSRLREGVVSEESDDGRPVWEDRRGCVVFPIPDAALRDAEPLGDIALEQLKVEPSLPDVIA